MRATTLEGQNAFASSLWFLCNPFHSFLVEVQMKLATYVSCMRNSNLKIRIAGSPCRPQFGYIILLTEPRTVLTMYKMFQNRCYTWFHNNWRHFFPNLSSISNCFKILSRQLGTPIKALNCKLHRILQWNNKLQWLKERFLLAFLHLTYVRAIINKTHKHNLQLLYISF